MIQKRHISTRGVSIIEALVGIFLFTTAFYALYGVLNFSTALIAQNKMRLGAMALVEEQIEYARSIPFASVGTVMGNPSGVLPQTETITLNGITYTRRSVVSWVDNPQDGLATDIPLIDTIPTDYKQVKVESSWNFRGATYKFSSVSNITPKGLETNVPGGIFVFTVLDEQNQPVQGATIKILKPTVIDETRYTNALGQWFEYGVPPGPDYAITITKPGGYSTALTYAADAVLTNPNPGHLTSIDDTLTPVSVNIDKVSGPTISLYNPPVQNTWSDTFADMSNLASTASTTVLAGNLELETILGLYEQTGSATSTWIAPANIHRWTEFSWNDDTSSPGTSIFYQVYQDVGGVATLVPDSKIPGNSAGLSVSPVSLTGLNDQSFGRTGDARIKISAVFNTTDTAVTPLLHSWTVKYDIHVPLSNSSFTMKGTKTIGTDAGGFPVYKFNQNLLTDGSGLMSTTTLEYDTYAISKAGYDIAESCPPQPQYIAPDTFTSTFIDMTPSVPHAIFVQAKDALGVDALGAHVRLYRAAPAFDEMKVAGLRCGQVFWNGLSEGTIANGDPYTIDVSASPYTGTTTIPNVEVSGYSLFTATI
jgi:hypothetical protein